MDSSRRAGPPRRPALVTRGRVSGTARRRRRAALERLSVLWVNRRETPCVKSASAAHASVASVVPPRHGLGYGLSTQKRKNSGRRSVSLGFDKQRARGDEPARGCCCGGGAEAQPASK